MLTKLVGKSPKTPYPHLYFSLLKMEWLLLIKLARSLLIQLVTTGVHGTVKIRYQVTHVDYRSLDFGKGSIEGTLIEDILKHKTELLALMQMAMGVC